MSEAHKNKDLSNLYKAVGEAISRWSTVELQLNQLFGISTSLVAMQPGGGFSYEDDISSAVLNSIDGFRGRLLMIDAAMNAALSELDADAESILKDWEIERKKVSGLHGNRNSLAHWRATSIYKQDGSLHRVAISQPSFKRSDNFATETDIQGWSDAFAECALRLANLVDRLACHRGLQRKHLERAIGQIQCTLPADPTLLEHMKQVLKNHI